MNNNMRAKIMLSYIAKSLGVYESDIDDEVYNKLIEYIEIQIKKPAMRPLVNECDDDLIEDKEEIIESLTTGKGTLLDKDINLLLEIERELTFREE